jgi:hypothetical protein
MHPWLKILWKAIVMNNYRRLAIVIGLMMFWLSSLAHATSFIIELNNGREITTTQVWEEGDEVKFFVHQGTAGVHRALVKSIQTSAPVYNDSVSRRAIPLRLTDLKASMADKSSPKKSDIRHEAGHGHSAHEKRYGGDMRLQGGASQAYREQKLALTSKFDEATKKYLEATVAGNPDSQKGALDERKEISKRIYALADEVKAKNGGVLPAWWNE